MSNVANHVSGNIRNSEDVDMSVQEIHVRQTSNFVLSDVILPKFGNRQHENPLQYLKDLQNFFDLRAVPEQSKLLVFKNSLKGSRRILTCRCATKNLSAHSWTSIGTYVNKMRLKIKL